MSNLNLKGKAEHSFDAIVVGSGISGGWAAKELCQKGLKTLVEDRAGQRIALRGIADRDDGYATLSGDAQPGRGRGSRGVLCAAHGDVLQSACGGGSSRPDLRNFLI
jgi:choline dehydrogenase-like flavoprotein